MPLYKIKSFVYHPAYKSFTASYYLRKLNNACIIKSSYTSIILLFVLDNYNLIVNFFFFGGGGGVNSVSKCEKYNNQ